MSSFLLGSPRYCWRAIDHLQVHYTHSLFFYLGRFQWSGGARLSNFCTTVRGGPYKRHKVGILLHDVTITRPHHAGATMAQNRHQIVGFRYSVFTRISGVVTIWYGAWSVSRYDGFEKETKHPPMLRKGTHVRMVCENTMTP